MTNETYLHFKPQVFKKHLIKLTCESLIIIDVEANILKKTLKPCYIFLLLYSHSATFCKFYTCLITAVKGKIE